MSVAAITNADFGAGAPSPLDTLPGRQLDKDELATVVKSLGDRVDLWREHVRYPAGERHYVSLHRDAHVDVWVLCWTPENDTGWHDHDLSSGAVRVVRGALRESNPRIGGNHREVVLAAGSTICFGPEHVHRLNGEAERSVSIHAYSPPLWRLGQYDITDEGVLRRRPVSYIDELRPVSPVPII